MSKCANGQMSRRRGDRKEGKEVERAARPFIRREGKEGREGSRTGGSPVHQKGRKGRKKRRGRMEGKAERRLLFLLVAIGFVVIGLMNAEFTSRSDRDEGLGRLAVAQAEPSGAVPPIGPLPSMEAPNPELVELGKLLFFDPRLSGDGGSSCATCHDPAKGWGDGMPLSAGYTGSLYFRNAKTILNASYARYFYWDGRLTGTDAETQVRDAITETHFMNMDGRLMLERLKQVPEYVELFQKTLGGEPSFGRTLKAIAAFEKTIVSQNVPFDQGKLSPEAQRGRELFEGKAGCIGCHNRPYFSDGKSHNTGVPENPDVFRDPLRHITFRSMLKFLGVPNYMNLRQDVGYYAVSKSPKDIGKFITPTLREVERTAPYMHNGVFSTLEEVIEFYNRGGGEVPNKSPLLKPLGLSEEEKAVLIAFLKSLSGDEIIVSPPVLPEYQPIENWRTVRN